MRMHWALGYGVEKKDYFFDIAYVKLYDSGELRTLGPSYDQDRLDFKVVGTDIVATFGLKF